jgi:hypothetical protein
MPDRVSLAELRTKVRERGEIRSAYVSDAALNVWINDSIRDLYDQLISANPDTFVKITPNITVVLGQDVYDLPEDFAALRRVEVLYSAPDDWRKMDQYSLQNRSKYNLSFPTETFWEYREMGGKLYLVPTPTGEGTIRAWYIPVPPKLVADADETDFVFGWDEYVVLDCCVKHAQKEESDPAPFAAKQQVILGRIVSRAKVRNYGEPKYVRDVEEEWRTRRWLFGKRTS